MRSVRAESTGGGVRVFLTTGRTENKIAMVFGK